MVGLYVGAYFTFWNCKLFSKQLPCFLHLPAHTGNFIALCTCQNWMRSVSLIAAVLVGAPSYLSPALSWYWAAFQVLISHPYILFGGVAGSSLLHLYLLGCLLPYHSLWKFFTYSFVVNSCSRTFMRHVLYNYFSHSVGSLFSSSMASFGTWTFLMLMGSSLFILLLRVL